MRKVITGVVLLAIIGGMAFVVTKKKAEAPEQVTLPPNNSSMMKLTSPAWSEGGFIPSKYTCDERNMSPPLEIEGVPEGAKTLVLIMDDPDVPKALKPDGVFDHWVLYNIPSSTTSVDEGAIAGNSGANGKGKAEYTGPCPPMNYEPTTHRYFFTLYATDLSTLNFFAVPTKSQVLQAIEEHILEKTILLGRYDRLKIEKENN
ncbi:MAG: YbhB/YbcL family Raf kinase inhibitor-like protein [Patescibacteria group bacterium]